MSSDDFSVHSAVRVLSSATSRPVLFSTWPFRGRRHLTDVIDMAASMGYDGLELCLPDPSVDAGALELSQTSAMRLRELAGSLCLTVHAPSDRLRLADTDDAVRGASVQILRSVLRSAGKLGARTVVVHASSSRPQTSRESHPALVDAVVSVADLLEATHTRLAIENVGFERESVDKEPEFLAGVVDDVDHPLVGVTLDTGHANLGDGGLSRAIDQLGSRIIHLHLHDNDGSADQHRGIGDGHIDFRPLTSSLGDLPAESSVVLEIFGEPASVVNSLRHRDQQLYGIGMQ